MSKIHFENLLAGAASVNLFGRRMDEQAFISNALHRADAEQIDDRTAMNLIMRERFMGQMAMVILFIICMSVVLVGLANEWDDTVLAVIAAIPGVAMVWVAIAQSRKERISSN